MAQKNITAKDREAVYKLIVSQLFYDGHQTLALNLAKLENIIPMCPPSDKLTEMILNGFHAEQIENLGIQMEKPKVIGIDLDKATESSTMAPEPGLYETCYVTSHKAACRAGCFSADGQLIATGSVDASIKILDVDRMNAKSALPASMSGGHDSNQHLNMEAHPVIRTLYDHTEEVTCLEFHPTEQILISGSKDLTIKFFDFSKPSVKRAFKTIQEAEKIRCMALHPLGDYLLVGTEHPTLRMYDTRTSACFVSSVPLDQHLGPITMIKYSPTANVYATSSKDGSMKLWDGVSNKCINTFSRAHNGEEVCSVQFSKNGKYVLSSGKDTFIKLWELSMSRCLIEYTGAGAAGRQTHRSQACFNHTEDFVIFSDEKSTSLCTWDSRNAERQKLLSLGHNNSVRYLCHSLTSPAFLSCSDDYRARFWCRRLEN